MVSLLDKSQNGKMVSPKTLKPKIVIKKFDYKHQIERLKEIVTNYQVDKLLMNPLNDYDRGRHDAEKKLSTDFITLIKRALKGRL